MKNIPFARRPPPGLKSGKGASTALSAGRNVDRHLKEYAQSGKMPPTNTKAGRICRNALAALRPYVQLDDANVFVKYRNLKTHVDALGWNKSSRVVVELKTTTRTLHDFLQCYHVPCSKNPTLLGCNLANTEANHHMLQLGWTTMAYRTQNQNTKQVSGVLVVAATDKAKIFLLDNKFGTQSFWTRIVAAVPPIQHQPTSTFACPKWIPLWATGRGCRALERAAATRVTAIVANGKAAQTECGGIAFCCPKEKRLIKHSQLRSMYRAAKTLGATTAWVLFPTQGGWHVQPLQPPQATRKNRL